MDDQPNAGALWLESQLQSLNLFAAKITAAGEIVEREVGGILGREMPGKREFNEADKTALLDYREHQRMALAAMRSRVVRLRLACEAGFEAVAGGAIIVVLFELQADAARLERFLASAPSASLAQRRGTYANVKRAKAWHSLGRMYVYRMASRTGWPKSTYARAQRLQKHLATRVKNPPVFRTIEKWLSANFPEWKNHGKASLAVIDLSVVCHENARVFFWRFEVMFQPADDGILADYIGRAELARQLGISLRCLSNWTKAGVYVGSGEIARRPPEVKRTWHANAAIRIAYWAFTIKSRRRDRDWS
jgi:hypothetical protein